MDYSTLPSDPNDPVETSPWSSSPRATRRSLQASTSSDLQSSSDLSAGAYNNGSATIQPESERRSNNHDALGITASTRAEDDGNVLFKNNRRAHERTLSSDEAQPQDQGELIPEAQRPSGGSEPRTQPQPQRYDSTGRAAGRSAVPQYKLHAKITGLERTGRKDPILRFDVHVLTG